MADGEKGTIVACVAQGEALYALRSDGFLARIPSHKTSPEQVLSGVEFLERYGEQVTTLEMDEGFSPELAQALPRLKRLLCACTVRQGLFRGHPALESVTLFPGSRAEREAFACCPMLKKLWLHRGTQVEDCAFSGCSGLETVTADDGFLMLDPLALAGTPAQNRLHLWPAGGTVLYPVPVEDPAAYCGSAAVFLSDGECYTGQVSGGCFQGTGKLTYGKNHYYRGTFVGGKPDGHGLLRKGGVVHEGVFRDGEIRGAGVHTVTDETVRTIAGKGVLRWTVRGVFTSATDGNGTFWNGKEAPEHLYYRGDFVDGKFHGQGMLFITPELVLAGEFAGDNLVHPPQPELAGLTESQLRRVFRQTLELYRDLEAAGRRAGENPELAQGLLDSVRRDCRELNTLTVAACGQWLFPEENPEALHAAAQKLLSHLQKA